MKTIKSAGLAVLSLFVLITSCSEERIETNKDNKLSFGVALGKQTLSRVTEFTGTSWEAGDVIPVKSYNTSTGASFQDFTITRNSSDGWDVAAPTYPVYQPGYSLTYYAWFPTTIAGTTLTSGGTTATLNYTIGEEADQEDLIFARTVTSENTVKLEFNHILSQVNFAIQGVENVKVKLTNIKINNVESAGVYTSSGTSGWALQSTPVQATYTYIPVTDTNITDGTEAIFYMGNGGGTNNKENALMLLPQTFASADDGTISFDYELANMGNTKFGEGSATANLSDFTATSWIMGKRYLYLIDFTSFLAGGPITFTVSVNGWEDDVTVAETLEVGQATKVSIEDAIGRHNTAKGNNTNLKVFPISFPASVVFATDPIVLKDFTADKFATNDEIRIKCPSTTESAKITLDGSLGEAWSLVNTAAVVVLKKK